MSWATMEPPTSGTARVSVLLSVPRQSVRGIAESEREGTRAETRIGLSAKRTSPFKSAGGSVQSTTGSRGVRISRQDYWLPTPFASFPFTSPPVRYRVPSHSDSALAS